MPKLSMNLLKGQCEEATGLPPYFSACTRMELKSLMHSQEASKLSPIAAKESQKALLSLLFDGP
jgi:hypothetical protein